MKRPIPQLLLSLATTDATRNELLRFFSLIENRGAQEVCDLIIELRSKASDLDGAKEGRPSLKETGKSDSSYGGRRRVAERVQELLLREASLPKARAAELLEEKVISQGYDRNSLPSSNKVSFREWVHRLSYKVNPNVLLEAASEIRAKYAQGSRLDWPLRRGE